MLEKSKIKPQKRYDFDLLFTTKFLKIFFKFILFFSVFKKHVSGKIECFKNHSSYNSFFETISMVVFLKIFKFIVGFFSLQIIFISSYLNIPEIVLLSSNWVNLSLLKLVKMAIFFVWSKHTILSLCFSHL